MAQTIELPLGTAKLVIPADEAARILIAQFTKPAIRIASKLPQLGEFWQEQGGVFVGMARGYDGHPDYALIAAQGPAVKLAWGGYEEDEPRAKSDWDGVANTRALVESEHDHPAAEHCANLRLNGFADWYLPAKRESALCYTNVPELFDKCWHWTSTQYSAYGAWDQYFNDGTQGYYAKDYDFSVRAVRRVINLDL